MGWKDPAAAASFNAPEADPPPAMRLRLRGTREQSVLLSHEARGGEGDKEAVHSHWLLLHPLEGLEGHRGPSDLLGACPAAC